MLVATLGDVGPAGVESNSEQRLDSLSMCGIVRPANQSGLEFDLAVLRQLNLIERAEHPVFEYGMNCLHRFSLCSQVLIQLSQQRAFCSGS
jgi:hypothetical protein